MKKLWAKAAAAVAVLSASALVQAQPPPPPPPGSPLRIEIDGYSIAPLAMLWQHYVGQHKGEAIDQLLSGDFEDDDRQFHGLIASFDRSADSGKFISGRVESHCRLDDQYQMVAGSCSIVLVVARLAGNASDPDTPLGKWTADSFDPHALVGHLRSIGMPPDTDWWRADRDRIFSASPSPVPVLVELGHTNILTEENCPAVAAAVRAIESRRLTFTADLAGVGDDPASTPRSPHGVSGTDRLFLTSNGTATMIQQTLSFGSAALLQPILNAAEDCLRGR